MKKTIGFICGIWAFIFARLETKHFGNNMFPQTNEEIICDITALLLCICGGILFWQKSE